MKSLKIPSHISLKIYKGKDKKVVIIKDSDKSSLWFLIEDDKLEVKDEIIFGKSNTIRSIKKCLMSLEIGHKRTLVLLGVGYKATLLDDNYLAVKVSSVPPFLFKIPNDVSIKIEKDSIICWSYHQNIIDNFFKKIILKVNFAKWN